MSIKSEFFSNRFILDFQLGPSPFWDRASSYHNITLEPFLNGITKDDAFMLSSDKILTLAEPTPTLLEKYQDIIKE